MRQDVRLLSHSCKKTNRAPDSLLSETRERRIALRSTKSFQASAMIAALLRGFPTASYWHKSGKADILIIRFMKKTSITVTEASRNFADCVNRAHYQNVTFVLLKNGEPVARLVPDNEKVCVGRDLAEALAKTDLPENEARAWHRDLEAARKSLKAPADKWR
jgi:antitoxin (DNA-binding transcriptional repressor) of toxin-antitoxin stability system